MPRTWRAATLTVDEEDWLVTLTQTGQQIAVVRAIGHVERWKGQGKSRGPPLRQGRRPLFPRDNDGSGVRVYYTGCPPFCVGVG